MDLPFRVLRPFLGLRIIKTGLAVFLVLAAAHALHSQYGTFAAVAAILAVQPSVSRARSVFTSQLLSNLIGGAVGALLGFWLGSWLGSTSLAMALAVILVLGLCVRLGLNETASSAVVAVLFIMDRPGPEILLYTLDRIGAVVGGMLIGTLVNRFIKPPDYTARIRDELRSAAEDLETFGVHLATSLASPEHYRKEQIKAEAKAITRKVENAGYFLDLYHESGAPGARLLALDKAKGSLFVFTERITDIHKIVLQAGGLRPGPEIGAVVAALRAVLAYKSEVLAAALDSRPPDPALTAAFAETSAALARLAEELIDERATRERGLALHSVLTNIRHMGWRMDSLTRLLTGQ